MAKRAQLVKLSKVKRHRDLREIEPSRTPNSLDEAGTNTDKIGHPTSAVHSGEKWPEMNEVKMSNARLESNIYLPKRVITHTAIGQYRFYHGNFVRGPGILVLKP
jgi:hypothetical protein